jgi:hypothetical protein
MKLTSVLLSTVLTLKFTTPCLAEDRTFSPTEFRVCGEDSSFTRPSIKSLTDRYLKVQDRWDIHPKNHSRKKTEQLVLRRAGKLFTSSSIIYSAKSGAYSFDTDLASGVWNNNVKEWHCSKLNFLPFEQGNISQVVLFGHRIKSIRQTGYNYVMTVSNKKEKGIQYIAVDRSLNGKLKIKTVDGRILELVDLHGQKDFENKPDSYLNDGI